MACLQHLPGISTMKSHSLACTQAWGENIKAATQEFAAELARRHTQGDASVADDTPVYFDLFGRFLVTAWPGGQTVPQAACAAHGLALQLGHL